MARIKIGDLPKDIKISRKEMRKVVGGLGDINDLTLDVLRDAYNESQSALSHYAAMVDYFNSEKEQVRSYLKLIRSSKSDSSTEE